MTLTDEQATALRRPFQAESIGKLPKPLRRDDNDKGKCERGSRYSADGHFCGGYHARSLHLDYVGHAATTDRLLAVDPQWSWEPLALDTHGLPAFDAARNLWIKLTICGVTRIGVGDGKSAKECIGDAIRNAAMRFGVALDLWAKEDLIEFAQAAQNRQAASASADATPQATNDDKITQPQQRMMRALLAEVGLKDRDAILEFASQEAGRAVTTSADLTKVEAGRVIDSLEKLKLSGVNMETGETA